MNKQDVQRDTVVTHTALALGITWQEADKVIRAAEREGYRWHRV